MANKEIKKRPVNKDIFLAVLHAKGYSIAKLDEEYDSIQRSSGTIRKYLNKQEMSVDLLETIADFIGMDTDILAGCEYKPSNGSQKEDYFSYFEWLLRSNGVSIEEFQRLPIDRQINCCREIDQATAGVIRRYFGGDRDGD